MHPQEFATKMIANGRAEELAEFVRKRASEHYGLKSPGHEEAYNFVNMFMISVVGQLRLLEHRQTLDDDDILRVWRSLGLWGLDRQEIAEYVKSVEI
jgi:hypothetical protein